MGDDSSVTLAFVSVQNAGRSQMSTAFAERERDRRGLEDSGEIRTGGTHPADSVHDEIVAIMQDHEIDLSDRIPREVSTDEPEPCDVVATMGCPTLELDADDADGCDWALENPEHHSFDQVRPIRDDIEQRVTDLFDEVDANGS